MDTETAVTNTLFRDDIDNIGGALIGGATVSRENCKQNQVGMCNVERSH